MKTRQLRLGGTLLLALVIPAVAALPARAKGGDYEAVVNHLKSHYHAKRQHIPFLGLARFAAKIVRPAGVKSFDLAIFEDLKFDGQEHRGALRGAMAELLGNDWQPVVGVSSINRDQSFVYARDTGDDVNLIIVNIEGDQATLIRVKLSPAKLVEFLQDPKIMGVSLSS